MRKFHVLICLACAAFVLAQSTHLDAATYYVSSSDVASTDSGPGTQAQPWKTIAKVNATTLTPGDTVYFKCGDIWRETLVVKSGTQSGATTTYTSYGTGAKPVISGANLVTGWTSYTGGTANTYQAPLANSTVMVTSDNTFIKKGSSATTLAANQYYWSAGVLYLNLGGDPATHVVEAAQRNNAVLCQSSGSAPKTYFYHNALIGLRLEKTNSSNVTVQSSKFWTVQNCELYFGNSATADGAGVNVNNSDNFTVTDSHVNYALGDGIIVYNSINATVSNNLVENVFDGGVNSGGDGIQVDGNRGANSTDNFKILNNIVSRPNTSVEKGCIIAQCGQNGIISGNTCTSGKFGISLNGSNGVISYNYVTGTGIYGGIRISRDIDMSGMKIFYNIVTNTVGTGFGCAGITITDDTRDHTGDPVGDDKANRSNFLIANNVLYNTYYGISIDQLFSGVIRNNIVWTDTGFASPLRFKFSGIIPNETLVVDNNIWQIKGTSSFANFGSSYYSTLATWQATGYDAHSTTADPLFANPSALDFSLQSASPAIDAGADLGLTEDYDGTVLPQGGAPDIGAYEYVAPVPIVVEAESVPSANITASAGDVVSIFNDTAASAGAGSKVASNAVGDYINYLVNVPAGTYTVKVRFKKFSSRGIFQLAIDGVNQGAAQDEYTSATTNLYTEVTLGSKTFATSGDHSFRFTVTGRNAGNTSAYYDLTVDRITLTP